MSLEQGAVLLQGGRFHEAIAAFSEYLRHQPASLTARIGLARAHGATGDPFAAAAWLSDALRVAPDAPEPLQMLADLLLSQNLYAQALPHYRHLVERPRTRTAANLLHAGFCAEQVQAVDEAATSYRASLALQPDLMEAHVDLAGLLWRLEDFDGALAHARRAVELAPRDPYAVRILGTALLNLNRLDEAERQLRHALELQPDFALAQLDLAFALLAAGRLEEGWARWEDRWNDRARSRRPNFFHPDAEWTGPGMPLAGKALAVYAEQGWGDVIQFVRYLPRLQALGAQVFCVVQPELAGLVEESFPGVPCLRDGRDFHVQLHAALLDLPRRFGTTLQDLPAQVPYLHAPSAARGRWQQRLAPWSGKPRIGLAWSGSHAQVNNRNRALPLSTLLPLLGTHDAHWFSLQKGDGGAYTDSDVAASGLVDLTGEWDDFTDSAAMIEQLDLVITVDTSIAHLSGALGRPTWVMLAPNADWRWLQEREDSPWYPTARLFRRGFGEDRASQVERVSRALASWNP